MLRFLLYRLGSYLYISIFKKMALNLNYFLDFFVFLDFLDFFVFLDFVFMLFLFLFLNPLASVFVI